MKRPIYRIRSSVKIGQPVYFRQLEFWQRWSWQYFEKGTAVQKSHFGRDEKGMNIQTSPCVSKETTYIHVVYNI